MTDPGSSSPGRFRWDRLAPPVPEPAPAPFSLSHPGAGLWFVELDDLAEALERVKELDPSVLADPESIICSIGYRRAWMPWSPRPPRGLRCGRRLGGRRGPECLGLGDHPVPGEKERGQTPGPPGPGAPLPARDHPGLGGRGHHRCPRGRDDLPPGPGHRSGPGQRRGPAGRPGPEVDLCPVHRSRRLLETAGRSRRGRPGGRETARPPGRLPGPELRWELARGHEPRSRQRGHRGRRARTHRARAVRGRLGRSQSRPRS